MHLPAKVRRCSVISLPQFFTLLHFCLHFNSLYKSRMVPYFFPVALQDWRNEWSNGKEDQVSRNVHWYNRLGIQVVLHLELFSRIVIISRSLEGVAEKFIFCGQISLWFFFQKENLQSEKAKSELENLLIHLPILIRFKGTVVPDQCKVASVFAALVF